MSIVLQKVMLGILVFSLVTTIFITVFNEGMDTYEGVIEIKPSGGFNQTLNKAEETINLTQSMTDQMFNTESITGITVIDSLIKGSFSSLKIVWRSFDIANDMIDSALMAIGFPEWVISILQAILLTVIGFSILFILLNAR